MALTSSEYGFVRNTFGALGLIALSPLILIALLVKIVLAPFERPAKRPASYVVERLHRFLRDEHGDDRFWDEFIGVPLADPVLEDIRVAAAMLELPLDDAGRQDLRVLITRAEAVAARNLSTIGESYRR